jgi:hypothetical protein
MPSLQNEPNYRRAQRGESIELHSSEDPTYGAFPASAGYSRRKLLDRMIAAQALVHRATLVTFNPDDFSDVPGLSSLVWPSSSRVSGAQPLHLLRQHQRGINLLFGCERRGFIPEEAGRGPGYLALALSESTKARVSSQAPWSNKSSWVP